MESEIPAKARRWAVVTGLAGFLLAVSLPFLPARFTVTTVEWPTAQGTRSLSAPLVSYSPVRLDVTVPCATAHALDARLPGPGVLVSTTPPGSPPGAATGFSLRVDAGRLVVRNRGQEPVVAALPAGACSIRAISTAEHTAVSLGETPLLVRSGDERPQLTGIFSDLDAATDDVHGLAVRARVDDRFDSDPSSLKLTVAGLAILACGGAGFALRGLDRGTRPPRARPRRFRPRRPGPADVVVGGALAAWWLIGPLTPDDGYVLTMARDRAAAGYVPNYFRWFGSPESLFGWFYDGYALWARVSTSVPWLRLPSLLLGVATWFVLSRMLLPRLGSRIRRAKVARWAAAAAFLACWLPFDAGLRAEPVVVLFSALALAGVERAVATRRLTPLALAAVSAGLAVAAIPNGLLGLLPFAVAPRPLVRLVRARATEHGGLSVLAPLLAAFATILVVIYWDRTWQSVVDVTRLRFELGPAHGWYDDYLRYLDLFSETVSGSIAYRFPVLVIALCLATCTVVTLRRRIRGLAPGPVRRLLAMTALSFVVLMLAPTKLSHHFGAFAALGGALGAVTAVLTGPAVLRSRRNRALFAMALLVACAFALSGPNAYWYLSGWGVPWADRVPELGGIQLRTVVLGLAAVAGIVALAEHLRTARRGAHRRPRARFVALPLVCTLAVLGEFASTAIGMARQRDGFSLGLDNVSALTGGGCGLADHVLVETDAAAGVLPVSPGQPPSAWVDDGSGSSRTPWYELPPPRARAGLPVVLPLPASAGELTVEFGQPGRPATRHPVPRSGAPEARIPVDGEATAVRFLAATHDLREAIGPPRVPRVRTLTEVVGDAPVLIDWPAAFPYPCVTVAGIRDGIADVPRYRIDGSADFRFSGWSCPEKGGPSGWLNVLATARVLPTYLSGQPGRDWGELRVLEPYAPQALPAAAALVRSIEEHPGTWSPGPPSRTVSLPPGGTSGDDVTGFLCTGG
ncbi:arabinosyltransferase domain-containing protein [Amycolatopsis anabasis]|uniref:arabinosyltransferase domain-containing protein n=1 Tax=Amycolatopsis anabasis TaxID=1840409 RepID=UPI00131CF9BF|nr:arabinosyltransferase domain-containing protein [Amycolatopsis anabasis]